MLITNNPSLLTDTSFEGISQHKYGFTDNEFLYFIAELDPVEYIITITVITIIISLSFNTFEQYLIFGALVDIGVTGGNMVQQVGFQYARQGEILTAQRGQYRQQNFDALYTEIEQLQNEITNLKNKLNSTTK